MDDASFSSIKTNHIVFDKRYGPRRTWAMDGISGEWIELMVSDDPYETLLQLRLSRTTHTYTRVAFSLDTGVGKLDIHSDHTCVIKL